MTVIHPNTRTSCSRCGYEVMTDAFTKSPLCIGCLDSRPDEEALSPGVRRTVMMLWRAGFHTVDSGDGKSNEGMGCEIDIANVHMTCESGDLTSAADDLHVLLSEHGVDTGCDPGVGPFIQATYNPADGSAIVSLYGVDDHIFEEDPA